MNTYVHRLRCAMIVTKAARAHCVDRGRRDRGMRETKPLGSKTQAQAPFRPKGTFGLRVAAFADSFLMAHPPAHSTVRTAMGSVSFPAFALTLLHFPCPAHEPPPNTGTPTCADGLRRYALAFVAVCFLPHGLKPSGSVAGNRETQRFGFFKARWAPGRQSQA